MMMMCVRNESTPRIVNAGFSLLEPQPRFWGQTSQIPSSLPPKRDCGSIRVKPLLCQHSLKQILLQSAVRVFILGPALAEWFAPRTDIIQYTSLQIDHLGNANQLHTDRSSKSSTGRYSRSSTDKSSRSFIDISSRSSTDRSSRSSIDRSSRSSTDIISRSSTDRSAYHLQIYQLDHLQIDHLDHLQIYHLDNLDTSYIYHLDHLQIQHLAHLDPTQPAAMKCCAGYVQNRPNPGIHVLSHADYMTPTRQQQPDPTNQEHVLPLKDLEHVMICT